jgi:hypothetical protein
VPADDHKRSTASPYPCRTEVNINYNRFVCMAPLIIYAARLKQRLRECNSIGAQ